MKYWLPCFQGLSLRRSKRAWRRETLETKIEEPARSLAFHFHFPRVESCILEQTTFLFKFQKDSVVRAFLVALFPCYPFCVQFTPICPFSCNNKANSDFFPSQQEPRRPAGIRPIRTSVRKSLFLCTVQVKSS